MTNLSEGPVIIYVEGNRAGVGGGWGGGSQGCFGLATSRERFMFLNN